MTIDCLLTWNIFLIACLIVICVLAGEGKKDKRGEKKNPVTTKDRRRRNKEKERERRGRRAGDSRDNRRGDRSSINIVEDKRI